MNQLTFEEVLAQRLVALTDAPYLRSVPYLDEAERADPRRLAKIGAPIAAKLRGEERP
jgi:hypothetical protein